MSNSESLIVHLIIHPDVSSQCRIFFIDWSVKRVMVSLEVCLELPDCDKKGVD